MVLSDTQRDLRADTEVETASPLPEIVAALATIELRAGMRLLDAGCGPG